MDAISLHGLEDRVMYLAYTYDALARQLMHAKSLSFEQWMEERWKTHFDIYDTFINACVEVKAWSNMDQLKLFSSQLDHQSAELGFPFDQGFTMIFSYRNFQERGGVRTRLLHAIKKTETGMHEFVAKNTTHLYVLDLELLQALKECNGTHPYSRDPLRERRLLSLNRSQIKELSTNARESLTTTLGADHISRWLPHNASSIPTRMIELEFKGFPMKFELFPLLPQSLRTRFVKGLNGAVKRK